MMRPPVIILGMHRSGTTVLTKCLEAMGLFCGAEKEINNEAVFFQRLNEWMLAQARSSWDNVYYFRFIDAFYKRQMIRVATGHLTGPGRTAFLGRRRSFKYRDIRELDIPWGWKDPRNTFTIDVWKEVFTCARILHVYRNPVDVAASLKKREEKTASESESKDKRREARDKKRELRLEGLAEYMYSFRARDIREGIKLWEEYVTKAFALNEEFKGRILHVQYESFLEDHARILREILNFCGLDYDQSKAAGVGRHLRTDRKFAFRTDESLMRVYDDVRRNELMRQLGYHDIA